MIGTDHSSSCYNPVLTLSRVHVSGIRGAPPPYTTKLAIFYKGGYEMQFLVNATGYAVDEKFKLFEKQIRSRIGNEGQAGFDSLHFQR